MWVDTIEHIKGSVIQHGPHNHRIYLMRLNTDDIHGLIANLDDMAFENGYGKRLAKIVPRKNPVNIEFIEIFR